MGPLRIGQLAEAAHAPVATLRYYEKRQLIPPPSRSPGGYRLYPMDTIKDVGFIRRAQRLGISLKEISGLLVLRATDADVCAKTRETAAATIERIDAQIGELARMRDDLAVLIGSCRSADEDDGPIIHSLEAADVTDG